MVKKSQPDSEMLKGTLDMMILRTLVGGDAHGHTIAKVIERTSDDILEVEQGSLYPALHRLEDRQWVSSYWGASENNRKAKFYRLTAAGPQTAGARNQPLAADDARHRAGDGRRGRRAMSWLRFFRRKRSDAELQDEMETFLAEETADNEARGMSPRRGPAAGAGEVGQSAEGARIVVGAKLSSAVEPDAGRDVTICLSHVEPHARILDHRGFGHGAVHWRGHVAFHHCALGVAQAASFPRSRPAGDCARAFPRQHGRTRRANSTTTAVAPADFYDWRAKTNGFEDMAIMRYAGYNLTGERGELPEAVRAAAGSWNLFSLLGVQPALGRDIYRGRGPARQYRGDAELERVPEAVRRRRPRSSAGRFTSTASPSRWSACCLRGSLIPMPASSCGFPYQGGCHARTCCSITTGIRARWSRDCAPT